MSQNILKEIVSSINKAGSGEMVGVTNYVGKSGRISSVTGQIGVSYQAMRERAIKELEEAITTKDFEDIKVSGQCRSENGIFNARKRSWNMEQYNITFKKDEVIKLATVILEAWKNPAKRESNTVSLSDKERGLTFNTETLTFNMSLMVQQETFKGVDVTKASTKPKAKAPETRCNEIIKKRFEKTIKSYTISSDNFKSISISGKRFLAEDVKL